MGAIDKLTLNKLLKLGVDRGVSDIHFQVGGPPCYRIKGELLKSKFDVLTPEATMSIAQILLQGREVDLNRLFVEQDSSYSILGISRFRVSIFRQRGNIGIIMRVVPFQIKEIEDLNLPAVVRDIGNTRRGLIMVTGATGMGKSTTIASIIDHINKTRQAHIVTIEDPIEFLFENKKSVITQREVGTDTLTYQDAMMAVLRQDPDVIMLGELRDAETANICLKAAETGHLVVTSLHTPNAISTIKRYTGFFDPVRESMFLSRLAECLQAVVSLRLVRRADGSGVLPAVEIMRVTHTLQECISDTSRHHEIMEHIAKGRDIYGMQTFDQHLLELVQKKLISVEVAKTAASRPDEIQRALLLE